MGDPFGAVISEHFRHPRNRGALESPDGAHEEFNPLCGDRIRMELKVDAGRVVAARFRGDACMVAIASASLLTGMVEGLLLEDAGRLPEEKLLAALETELKPSRVPCARLPLQAFRGALAAIAQSSEQLG
jgi:nitrogen fixation protein NifU and related proteins